MLCASSQISSRFPSGSTSRPSARSTSSCRTWRARAARRSCQSSRTRCSSCRWRCSRGATRRRRSDLEARSGRRARPRVFSVEAGEPLEDVPAGPSESAGFLARGTWRASAGRHERVELPGGPRSTELARRAVEEHFAAELDEDRLASVDLMTTELVSNAVRHGGGDEGKSVVLYLALAPGCLRIEVCDPGEGFDAGTPSPYGEGGYGLFIVSEVASRWGVAHDVDNCAWFELDVDEAA